MPSSSKKFLLTSNLPLAHFLWCNSPMRWGAANFWSFQDEKKYYFLTGTKFSNTSISNDFSCCTVVIGCETCTLRYAERPCFAPWLVEVTRKFQVSVITDLNLRTSPESENIESRSAGLGTTTTPLPPTSYQWRCFCGDPLSSKDALEICAVSGDSLVERRMAFDKLVWEEFWHTLGNVFCSVRNVYIYISTAWGIQGDLGSRTSERFWVPLQTLRDV